ncbi:MAG: Na/Pi cotransporter family protein [Solobacterium sp.]|jgi:phosphate:Na+ symporter|nr:Na/Pi cotransporter family protein [Solobacterium sp.]MCH4205252.1 Na/Pi cotransporter family protein [Solobacterium sp.]MCH4226845.1 Na/Pi cotransporter family protein [Solobacterium sp.]MCH4281605.1 Na/Pi cotransporter family protein [Solobacterium sp.]
MTLSSISWDMILGGFGLFMFGITFMGDGLKAVAGDKLRDYIDRYTTNPLSAMVIGVILTIIMQSSSATAAITIGFVRAGLMSLTQACGIVLGANIGTTITSFLISVHIDKYALYIVFLGALLICFSKKQRTKYIGQVIMGFGLIFYGMSAMGTALSALKEMPAFTEFAIKMSENPWLSMGAGVLLTACLQSSAATIGVMQNLYQAGAVTFGAAIPFMFGADIGTTMTGILASIGGSTSGKRTAAFHTTINILSGILGMILLVPFCSFIQSVFGSVNPMMQIAFANIIFKTVSTFLIIPFLKYFVLFVQKVIPGKEPERLEVNIDELDANVANVLPSAALTAAQGALLKMVDVVKIAVLATKDFLNDHSGEEEMEIIKRNEAMVNDVDKKITNYLIQVSVTPNMTQQDTLDVRLDLDTCKNLERLGDLAINLGEFYMMVFQDKNGTFTDIAMHDINKMYDQFINMFDLSAEIFVTKSRATNDVLQRMEEKMDEYEYTFREDHFKRMSTNRCASAVAASVYCDILGTLERMGDHCCNIARSALSASPSSDLSESKAAE